MANVQVHIFQDRVEITNPGGLPAGMTIKMLGEKSIPRNPLLFSIFYRMELVEKLGSGIKRIRRLCKETGVEEPIIEIDDNWFTIIFRRDIQDDVFESGAESGVESRVESRAESRVESILLNILELKSLSTKEIAFALNRSTITGALKRLIKKMLHEEYIEYTIPNKPNSRLQKYKITDKGKNKKGRNGYENKKK